MLVRRVRLRSGRDFRAVYSRSKTLSTPTLVLALRHWKNRRPAFSKVDSKVVRFGFSISKKTAKKAHDRNRIKRQLREIVRHDVLPYLKQNEDCDTIVTVRTPAMTSSFQDLARDLGRLYKDSGLLRD